MPQWQGKSKGTPLGYRIFVLILKSVGVRAAYVLLRFVALYYFLFSWRSSRFIYQYFRRHHQYGSVKAFSSIYSNYYVFGQTLLDKIAVMAEVDHPFTFDFDGEEHLHDMVKMGKGGMLISAHVGNWEAAGHLLKRLNTRINIVMYDAEHARIKDYLAEVTGEKNFNVIAIREDMSHVYEISEALQRNEFICLHADRYLELTKTVTMRFLNGEARFPLGPFHLAEGFRVPVSVVFAFKASATHYHFYGTEPMLWNAEAARGFFSQRLMERFVKELEEKVKQYPEQWFNYYNFWIDNPTQAVSA